MWSRKNKIIFFLLVLGILAGLGVYAFHRGKISNSTIGSEGANPDRFYKVKRTNLVLGVDLTGTVNAKKKYKIAYEVPFNTKLIYVVDENSTVKKGQVLAKYETDVLQQKIEDLSLVLENKKKSLEIAKKERNILISSNNADVTAAENRLVEAEEAFNKYIKYDGPRQKDNLMLAVETAEQKLKEAESQYKEELDVFNNTIFSKESDMAVAKLTLSGLDKNVKSQKTAYNNATLNLKIFKRYTYPNTVTAQENKLDEAKLNLEKVRISTRSKLRQHDDNMYSQKISIKKLAADLKKYSGFMPKMVLYSPVDGIVIYGDPDKRWGKVDVKIGMDAKRNRVILTIPDLRELIVDFDLPEQYRSKVSLGDKAVISPESSPTTRIDGVVSKVETLPVNQIRWDPYSPKIYKAIIDVKGKCDKLVSGMNVNINIVRSVLKNRLVVPVEAVFEKNGKYLVYVKTDAKYKEAMVEIGLANENSVEVVSGLREGDVVYLFRPFQTSVAQ